MPYNYIIHEKIRERTGMKIENTIIAIDEGHNIAKACESSLGYNIKYQELLSALKTLQKL